MKHTKDIATGVLKGLLSDTDDVGTCVSDALSAGAMFGAAAADIKAGKVLEACTDVSIALGKIQPLANDCNTVKGELAVLAKELKDINEEKAMKNFKAQHSAIMEELAHASESRDDEKYEDYGMHIGFALRKIIADESVVV